MKKHKVDKSDSTGDRIDRYFVFHREERENLVIFTGLDFTLEQKILPVDKDVEVYADELSISGNLLLPGKNMTITARRITSENSCINTSNPRKLQTYPRAKDGDAGNHNEPNGKSGDNGKQGVAGSDAGRIIIVAESFSGHLGLVADGSTGGTGQDGGNGGIGANGLWGNDAKIRHAIYDKVIAEPTPGLAGGNGGNGGIGGKGGTGGKGGIITVGHVTGNVDVTISCDGGKGGSPGAPGQGGTGGPGGKGGRKAHCEMHAGPAGQQYDCDLGEERAASGPNGKNGNRGAEGPQGDSGAPGSAMNQKKDYADLRDKYQWNIEQRILTFHKAKLACFNGNYDQALELFLWLYHVIPETPPEAADLYRRVEVQISQLSQGLDFFGKPRNHVPLASLKYYQDQLDSFFIQGKQIEQAYTQYIKFQDDKDAQRRILRRSISLAESALKVLADNHENITKQVDQTQDSIRKLSDDLSAQEVVVTEMSSKFKKELENYFEVEVFSDVFKILFSLGLMCASEVPEMKKVIDIGGKIAPDIFKKLSFKDMIKLIKTVKGDIKDLSEKWKEISSYITEDDPDAAKLVMDRRDFDKIMKAFLGKIPSAAKFVEEMHKYMDVSDARNTQVFVYNACQLQLVNINAEIDQKTSELKRIQDELAHDFDPTSSMMRSYMLSLYLGVKEQLLDYLFQENQAYRYWSCSWRPLSVSDNSIADLDTAHLRLKSDILDLMNTTGPRQPWSPPKPFSFKKSEAPEAFASFIKGMGMPVSVQTNDPAFLGWSRVIATEFTIQVKGAKTSNDTLYVRLCSNGRAPFLNEKGEEFVFSHSQIFPVYEYCISTEKKIAGGNLGGDKDEYIGLSPYESWIIEVPKKYNDKLDLSQVKEIVLDFKGTAFPRTNTSR